MAVCGGIDSHCCHVGAVGRMEEIVVVAIARTNYSQ